MKKLLLFAVVLLLSQMQSQTTGLQWVKQVGTTGGDQAKDIEVNAAGEIYYTGYVNGILDMDPGPGVSTFTPASGYFLSKLDAAGNFVWVIDVGANSNEMALDNSGNILLTGAFSGTVDFDPGAGTTNVISAGSNDAFVAKYSPAGALIWAGAFGGLQPDIGNGVATDNAGNVYCTGYFQGPTDFDPGVGTFTLASSNYDAYICKLSSSGSFVWAGKVGGLSSDQANAITVDAPGDIYVTGTFFGSADFDPGVGTANMNAPSNVDAFFLKLDGSGNYLWAKQVGNILGSESGTAITLHPSGDIIFGGHFYATVDFDPGAPVVNLVSGGSSDIFNLRLTSAGNFVFAVSFSGTGTDGIKCITTDASGNIFSTGYINGTTDLDPGTGTYTVTVSGTNNIYVSKLDASGNFIWGGNIGTTGNNSADGIAVNSTGDAYVSGGFLGTADFDMGSGTANYTSIGSSDCVVFRLGSIVTSVHLRETNENPSVIIYPNPSAGNFTLKSEEELSGEIIITDIAGKEIYKETLRSGNITFDIEAKGMYLLNLRTEKEASVQKIVVQ